MPQFVGPVAAGVDDPLADPLQSREAVGTAVLDDDLESARGAQAIDRRGLEDGHHGPADIALEPFFQGVGDPFAGEPRRRALVEVVEHDVQGAEVGRVGPQQDRLARHGHGMLDTRRLVRDFLDPGHDAHRALQARGVRQLHVHQQVAFVLRGNEPRRGLVEAPPGQVKQTRRKQQAPRRLAAGGGRRRGRRCWWPN